MDRETARDGVAATGHSTSPAGRLLASPSGLALPVLLLARLPLLGSPAGLDGDEAILGLMALDLLRGEGLPVFFLGQRYGLSTLEAVLGACSFAVLGISATTLRAAMLLLWAVGGWFVVATAHRLAGSRAGWIALALLATCPSWSDWSMKARGGYLTAFAAAHVGIWLLAGRAPGRRLGAWLAVGACAGIVLLSQPLWLCCLGPVAAMRAFRRRDLGETAAALGAGAIAILAALAASQGPNVWSPGLFRGFDPVAGLALLPGRLLDALGGAFLFESPLPVGAPTKLAAGAWLAATAVALVIAARPGPDPRTRAFRRAFAGAIVLLLVFSLPIGPAFGPRYLLPLPAMVLLVLAVSAGARRGRVAAASLAGLATLGAVALVEAAAFRPAPPPGHPYFQTEAEVRALVRELEDRGIRHAYSLDPLLQWNVMFTSQGRLQARWFAAADRIPGLPEAAERALRGGQPVALVGRSFQADHVRQRLRGKVPALPLFPVGEHLFWTLMPDEAAAEALGFEPAVGDPARPRPGSR